MTIQDNDDNYEVDFDDLDFKETVMDSSYYEPAPQFKSTVKTPFRGRNTSSRSTETTLVKDNIKALKVLDAQIEEICDNEQLNSRQKAELIKTISRQSGIPKDANAIVEIFLAHDQKKMFGSELVVINAEQGSDWFNENPTVIIEDFISKDELNIVGGLSGAAKTTFVSMFLAAILNPKLEPSFLGMKVNRELVKSVFFIGLDGGRNVYSPIFSKAGLLDEHGVVPNFNFIPSESGWSINTASLDKLGEQLKDAPDSIVVVDSLLAATSGTGVDENSAAMAGKILDLKLLCQKYGATPIVLAHQKKDSTQDTTGCDSLRGHSSIPCFAGQLITLNFLDQKAKVNGKTIPDRKSPKRRLVSGHRSLKPIDLLVELDFDAGTVSSHGDFYDALFAFQAEQVLEDELHSQSLQGFISEMSQTKQQVLEALRGYDAPVTQSTLINDYSFTKSTLSKRLKELQADSYRGRKLVVEYDTSDGKQYEITYQIKQELLRDY